MNGGLMGWGMGGSRRVDTVEYAAQPMEPPTTAVAIFFGVSLMLASLLIPSLEK